MKRYLLLTLGLAAGLAAVRGQADPPAAPPAKGFFVAGGHHGLRLTSANGTDWANAVEGRQGQVYRGFAFGKGRCVGVATFGNDSILAMTTDGLTWETRAFKHPGNELYMQGVVFGGGAFLAHGGQTHDFPGAYHAYRSTDGEDWGKGITQTHKKATFRRVAFGNGRFVGVADRGRRSASKDGIAWQEMPKYRAADTLVDVAFGKDKFVGVGLNGLRMTSTDGLTWENRQVGEDGEHLNAVVWTGDRFVAVGLGATYFSPDGIAWTRSPNQNAPLTAAYGNGRFVGTHWRGRILASRDAVTWKQVHKADHHLEAIAFGTP